MNNAANVLPFPDTLDDLVHQYVNAKQAEEGAKRIRIELEERILALAPAKEEGSTTTQLDNGFKLTTTGKLTYSCDDMDALIHACSQWPANLQPIKTVVQLDTTGCKFLRSTEPEVWRSLAKYITVAPAKTAITVKL